MENSKIAWTDHTFSPWWGCSRVSPGCEHCYAERLATVRRKLPVWGVDAERKPMSEAYWRAPLKWNRAAEAAGVRPRVFVASMADVFEIVPPRNVAAARVMSEARARLWRLIEATPDLDWLLLTKRPENVVALAPWAAAAGLSSRPEWPANVWLGTTAEDQRHYDKRWPILASIPARVRFISHEPALGPLRTLPDEHGTEPDWVITGGESGPGARPYDLAWARSLLVTCRERTRVFVKQLGARPIFGTHDRPAAASSQKWDDPADWPEDLRVQRFPVP